MIRNVWETLSYVPNFQKFNIVTYIYTSRDHSIGKVTKQISCQWRHNQLTSFKRNCDMISEDNLLVPCKCNRLSFPIHFLNQTQRGHQQFFDWKTKNNHLLSVVDIVPSSVSIQQRYQMKRTGPSVWSWPLITWPVRTILHLRQDRGQRLLKTQHLLYRLTDRQNDMFKLI